MINQLQDVEEQVENVENDLKELEKPLSSVRKRNECSKAFQSPHQTAREICQHLQNTPSNADNPSIANNNPAQSYLLFFNLWSSKAKTITESSNQCKEVKEHIEKVNADLKELDKSLSLVSKWSEGSKDFFQDLYEAATKIFEHLQKADNNDKLIIDKIDEIARKIREIKMQRLPFLKLFNMWSSKAETITESTNQWTVIKEKVEKVQKVKNDLRELDESLSLVSKWDKVSVDQFLSLHEMSSDFFKHFPNAPSNGDNSSPSKESDQDKLIDEIFRKIRGIKRQARPFLELLRERVLAPNGSDETILPTKWNRLESEEETLASPSMADVRSTYDDLDAQLKLCFLSLSIFPEDSIIRKRSLIYLWIGEGFVEGDDVEEIGEDCFKKLCESGLIEPIYRKQSRSPHSCKLHPWIRWMAITIAKETMFFDFNLDGQPCSGPSECPRRACVSTTDKRQAEEVDLKVKLQESDSSNLRSLFNVDVRFLECDEEDFKKHKNMTTLQLGRWNNSTNCHIEVITSTFLEHLGHLKGLRYLGLQGVSRITELPESISGLSEMRVLDLRGCHNLEKLPSGITSLKKLTHLDVSECYLLECMPKGLGSLSNLQFLDGFMVSNLRKREACKLIELAKLEKLLKLSISFGVQEEGVMTADRELEALQYMKRLHTLTITWGRVLSSRDEKNKDDEKTKKESVEMSSSSHGKNKDGTKTKRSFKLPSNLEKLDLRCYSIPKKKEARKQTTSTSKISLKLPPSLEKLDLRCYPKKEAPELLWGSSKEAPDSLWGSFNKEAPAAELPRGEKPRKTRGRSLLCGSKEAPAAESSSGGSTEAPIPESPRGETPRKTRGRSLLSGSKEASAADWSRGGSKEASIPESPKPRKAREPDLKKLYFRGQSLIGGCKEAPAARSSRGGSKKEAPILESPRGDESKMGRKPRLKKLYFRGGSLCSLNGIEEGGQVSHLRTVRLRFLNNLKITKHELEKMFPDLKYAEFYKCKEIKTSFPSNKTGDEDGRDDEASPRNGVATSRSPVVYNITEDDRL